MIDTRELAELALGERDLYRQRAHLVAALAARYPAVLSHDVAEPDCPDVIYLHTAAGQLSWHLHRDDLDLFRHVRRVGPEHPLAQWDGHSTGEKYHRLARLHLLTGGSMAWDTEVLVERGVQRLRRAGWRKPAGVVIVDRTSRYGNPFTVGEAIAAGDAVNEDEGRAVAVVRYRVWLDGAGSGLRPLGRPGSGRTVDRGWVLAHLADLIGRPLCCTCPVDGIPCHRDELRHRVSELQRTAPAGPPHAAHDAATAHAVQAVAPSVRRRADRPA